MRTRTNTTSRGPGRDGGECLGQTSIHPSAWKANSAKSDFRITEFSEVRIAPVHDLHSSRV
jgi:hypothetical protein